MKPVASTVGIDDAVENILRVCASRENRGVAVRAHAAGVGAGVAVEDRLVVLRRRERDYVAPVAERDEADFFAAEKFFDRPTGRVSVASAASASARSCATMTPLPAARPSAFSTTGKPKRSSARRASAGVFDGHEVGRGNSALHEKVLCKNLAAFELRRFARSGPTILLAARTEFVDHAGDQRRFRSDHRQVRVDFIAPATAYEDARRRQAGADLRDARIARRRKHLDSLATAPASTPARARVRRCR